MKTGINMMNLMLSPEGESDSQSTPYHGAVLPLNYPGMLNHLQLYGDPML